MLRHGDFQNSDDAVGAKTTDADGGGQKGHCARATGWSAAAYSTHPAPSTQMTMRGSLGRAHLERGRAL